ncbi:Peptidase C50, separase [Kalmanozyma brasiliensis GHG001]|uniref:Peptidase C50, separase n=1 Tax=Kalmanozyma brasiliensis (strain GHG001) TaxID=1365824 RepID=UPI002867BE80|nr:Peptidase C50, separase [Kalmanozyma brasiliensis GHG001]EST04999.2 Peptidase C50, separase [Kalmanozyma brasiliensis GHG001]
MPGKVATMPAASGASVATAAAPAAAKPVTRTRSAAGARATTTTTTPASTSRTAPKKASEGRTGAALSSASSSRATSATIASTSSATGRSTSTTSTRTTALSSRTASASKTAAVSVMPTVKGALASSSTSRIRSAPAAAATKAKFPVSQQPPSSTDASWTEAEVLAALASPRSLPTTLPHFVLLQLGTTATELDLGTELGNSPSFTSPPAKLSPARCVYFAKQLVNAGLAFFAELVTTGWLATGKETSSEVEHVIAAINTFRIASRFLLSTHHASASQSSGKQKKLEVETVILRTCSKLRTVGLTDIARAECEYLERLIVSVTSEDTSQHVTFLPPFQHTTNSISEPSPARISFLVDLQSNRVSHALESANSSTLDLILADLNHEYGPLAWQLYGRRHGGEVRVLDRAAFATERSISKALQRLEAPNNQEYLPLRTLALQLLVQVSDIDLTAFWERVARAGGAVLKTAQSQGEDVATAYDAVQDTFETIIATAANVAENSEAKTKLQGEGFQRFCEYWLSFARKAGSSVGIERATAALSGESLSAQSGSADCPIAIHDTGPNTAEVSSSKLVTLRAHLSDTDIAKICAALTGSVLALDNVLAGKSEEGTQAKLDEAARILTQKVAAWPVTGPMSSQLKLYRVLDQLHRRSCSKLSSQGCDSKGQPKADPTGSANVDKLAQACLQLLLSLLAHCEASTTSSSSSEVGAESTPARTASLPSRDACLTDIVYGYRVLANKLFNATSRVARQDAFSELKKCRDIMQTGLAQSLPNNVVAEQLRLLSTSFYNPAGILYNAASYVEAAEFLQLAVDCDDESLQLLQAADSALEQHELNGTLIKRREALNKKLEYTAVAYRFAGSKAEALRTYRRLLFSHARVLGSTLDHHVGSSSIEEVFKMADTKGLSGAIKAVVDLSVYELSLDMDPHDQDHSLVTWLTESNEVQASVKGAILEHCATLVEARSHLSNAVRAISNIQLALLQVYDATGFPLRRARTLARRLEMDVLSHALSLSEDEVTELEEDAIACLDAQAHANDEGLLRFKAQYRCSILLSTALHARLRQPFENPQTVATKVEVACKDLSLSFTTSARASQPATPQAPRSSPRTSSETPVATPGTRGVPRKALRVPGRTATARKALVQRAAPTQAVVTPVADPKTPPSKTAKPIFDAPASSLALRSSPSNVAGGAGRLDRPEHFCQSLLTYHEAFSALALTRCSVQILKAVRQAARHRAEIVLGLEGLFCRASADLCSAYLALGKPARAESVLRSATSVLGRSASPSSPSGKLLLVSQDVRFRYLMAQAQLLAQERDLAGAQARFAEGLKMAKAPSKSEKSATSSMDRLRQRERQAIAFSTCAHVQLARGDLAASIEATTLALRQLIRLSSNLSHIATRMQISEQDASQNLHSDGLAPSSDIVMESAADQQKQAEEQHLPKFCGSTFSGLFWRCCGLLLDNYTRLSRLHSVRGSAVDAEAMAGEGIDFATSLRFALPLARALVQRGEVRLQLNKAEGGQDDLSRCLEVLQNTWIPEVVSLSYVQGDCLMRIEQLGEALRSYTAGEATLRSLSSAFAEAEQVLASPMPKSGTHQRRISSLTSPGQQLRARLSNGVEMDLVLPELQSRLLQRQAWILHLMGEFEKSEQAVEKAASIRDGLATVDARVEQFVVEGRIALRRALEHLKNDHFFSMLPEAAISIPMVPSVSVRTLVAPAGSHQSISEETVKTAIAMLAPADSAFREALSLGLLSSHSLVLREAFASLAQVHTTQAALGKNVKMAANAAAGLLDWASSVGVRRNLLVAISAKLRGSNMATDDQEWPSITSGDLQSALVSRTQRGRSIEAEDLDEADALPTRLAKLSLNGKADAGATSTPSHPFSAFWQSVRLRHQQAQHEAGAAKHLLPRNWTVISISVRSTDVEHLVLTRQEGGGGPDGCTAKEAVLYSLPMNRRSQRDGTEEEEEQLTLKAAQDKIVEIVRLSNDGIHGVKDVQSMEARRQWWTERHRLDDELRDLLQAMQDTWLGGFKGVFSDPTSDARATAALRAKFEKIIRRACFPTANKRPAKLKLDDAVFECFAGLPVDCTDEDLEDLVHYVMDALQFSGFQVAVDEIDLDETAMDLRGALEEFNGKKSQTSPNKASMAYVAIDEEEQAQDHHIFLVLDKDTAIFPWESMPILRNRAVSRIPSMAFLQDRIELAKVFCQKAEVGQDDQEMDELELSPLQKGKHAARSALRSPTKGSRTTKATSLGSKSQTQVDEPAASAASDSAWQVALRNGKLFSLSQRKTFYLLNPGGDLLQSQDRFEPWLKQRGASQGWKGIVGRQPIVDELPDALSSSDLVLYFGHGGAEQFIRQSKVRELQRCAVAMLWGCSSAMLHDNGEFDRTGTPLNYMCAGAPAMVGNLWDMTDRELDSVCEGVFGRLGLMEAKERAEVKPAARNIKLDRKGNLEATRRPTEMSLARAVAESRNDCRLPYLTGAATVVYGVPVYWNESNL